LIPAPGPGAGNSDPFIANLLSNSVSAQMGAQMCQCSFA
jgi:hypothetical protein